MDDPKGGAVMIEQVLGVTTGRRGQDRLYRPAVQSGLTGAASETRHGVRPLLATIAAAATAMISALPWV